MKSKFIIDIPACMLVVPLRRSRHGLSPKSEDKTLPETPGATNMIYQEDTEKERSIPTLSALNPARKKIKQRTITRWSRLYKKVYAPTGGRKE